MAPDEALDRFAFDDRLFSLNSAGLWVGRSDGQIWIGETADSQARPLGYRDDRHVCLVSATRGGKGTGVIIPNLCLWPGSCIVIDPKGENATITANRRGGGSAYAYGMGQTVRILDPFGEVQLDGSLKARFNPLDAIDPGSDFAIDDAGRIASALVVVENRNDPFWEEAARDLIKILILHVLTHADFAGRRNLVSVWRLVNQGDWITADMLRDAGDTTLPSGFSLLWQMLKSNAAFSGQIAGAGDHFSSMAERTRSSILGAAKASLEFISGPPMQRLLEASDFDLAALKNDPKGLTLYLTLPQRYMATHFRWLRLMISLAVGEMERVKGRPATGHPTLFMLDEFAGLKRLEVIENAAAQAAGFGVKFFFIVQSLVQLKEVYKDSWEVFLGNSGLQLFFQIADDFTRSYLSRQVGEHEVRRESRSGSQSQSTSDSVTDGDSTSTSWGTSSSTTSGRNSGTSRSTSKGRSASVSLNYSGLLRLFTKSHSYQDGGNRSKTRSTNTGWSRSISSSESRTESTSQSWSLSRSRSTSTTDGWSEAVHKRPLLNPDEIGRLLTRMDDRNHPAYPGVMLALIQGEQPLLARRINYFESERFAGYFDPHPDFPPPPPSLAALEQRVRDEALHKALTGPGGTRRWQRAFTYVILGAGIGIAGSYAFPKVISWLGMSRNLPPPTSQQNAPSANFSNAPTAFDGPKAVDKRDVRPAPIAPYVRRAVFQSYLTGACQEAYNRITAARLGSTAATIPENGYKIANRDGSIKFSYLPVGPNMEPADNDLCGFYVRPVRPLTSASDGKTTQAAYTDVQTAFDIMHRKALSAGKTDVKWFIDRRDGGDWTSKPPTTPNTEIRSLTDAYALEMRGVPRDLHPTTEPPTIAAEPIPFGPDTIEYEVYLALARLRRWLVSD